MLSRILITGANAGLGKELARQLAQRPEVEKIYLGCRNREKAQQAKQQLALQSGRQIFEILPIDISDLNSVSTAVEQLAEPVDALVMNAGGTGGKQFDQLTKAGVSQICAVNLLGHSSLAEQLIAAGKLTQVAVYAGSEAARGVPEMGMKKPELQQHSEQEFIDICSGRFFAKPADATYPYGVIKYTAALWMAAMARQHPALRFVTVSPGATLGTEGFNSLPFIKQFTMKAMMRVMLLLGKVHKVEYGAERYIQALYNTHWPSGSFFASRRGLTGELANQAESLPELANRSYQDNAKTALELFVNQAVKC